MTTTTQGIESIRYTILSGNLLNDGTPTRAAVELLAQQTADALAAAFPGADVDVPVMWRTSGAGPRPHVRGDLVGYSATEERIAYEAGRVYEDWCIALADADYEV